MSNSNLYLKKVSIFFLQLKYAMLFDCVGQSWFLIFLNKEFIVSESSNANYMLTIVCTK